VQQLTGESGHGGRLHSGLNWAQYAAAVRRWERVLGCAAPAPAEPGRNHPRLSPAFAEWMMGVPAGHVTAVPGLTRSQQLKAIGNGVVPQQAMAAFTALLERRAAGTKVRPVPPCGGSGLTHSRGAGKRRLAEHFPYLLEAQHQRPAPDGLLAADAGKVPALHPP